MFTGCLAFKCMASTDLIFNNNESRRPDWVRQYAWGGIGLASIHTGLWAVCSICTFGQVDIQNPSRALGILFFIVFPLSYLKLPESAGGHFGDLIGLEDVIGLLWAFTMIAIWRGTTEVGSLFRDRVWHRLNFIPELAGLNCFQRELLINESVIPRGRRIIHVLLPVIVIPLAGVAALEEPNYGVRIISCALIFSLLWILVWRPVVAAGMRPAIRWAREGHVRCRHCGYDLFAVADSCPECGASPTSQQMDIIRNLSGVWRSSN
jgi:hypothetical protein